MEEWKEYYGYKISNKGRILNRFGKEIKGYVKKDRGYKYKVVVLRINGIRTLRQLPTLIYRLFGKNYCEKAHVFFKDGDFTNCDIENLCISRAYTTNPTLEQIEVYEKNIIACVKDFYHKQGYLEAQTIGMDIDNTICETYLCVWKYLSQFRIGTSFYSFCAKRARWTFLREYKKFKQEQRNMYYNEKKGAIYV